MCIKIKYFKQLFYMYIAMFCKKLRLIYGNNLLYLFVVADRECYIVVDSVAKLIKHKINHGVVY